jgi:hypothetical protein
MFKTNLVGEALSAALLACIALPSPGLAQSQGDIAAQITASVPDNGRGQITAAGLRGVLNALNGSIGSFTTALGSPNGVATLGSDGKLTSSQVPPVNSVLLAGVGALNTTYAGTKTPNAAVMGSGNSVSFCPALSCINGPTSGGTNPAYFDHQRASLLLSTTTQVDGQAEEQTLAVTTTVATGYAPQRQNNTAYTLGANVTVGPGFGGAVYRAITSGTTGTTAPPSARPTSLPYTYNDGSVTWLWINDAAINAKLSAYFETRAVPGAGQVWGAVSNLELDPGMTPVFASSGEFDITNNTGTDCAAGISNCFGLYVVAAGTNSNTSGIQVEGRGTPGGLPSSLFGIRLAGPLGSVSAISVATSGGSSALGIGTFGAASFSSAAIDDASTAPAGINMSGSKTLAAIRLAATTFNGIDLSSGTYSGSQITGINFSVSPTGGLSANTLKALAMPASAGSVRGTVCIDTTGVLYVKTTTGACL